MNFLFTSRELFLTSSVYDMSLTAKTKCCTGSVHSNVTTTDYNNFLAVYDRGIIALIKCFHQVVSGQELVCRQNTTSGLTRNTHEFRKSCTGTNEYCIESFVLNQLINGNSLTDDNISLDLNTERFYVLNFRCNYAIFRKTELRNTIYKYSTCFM